MANIVEAQCQVCGRSITDHRDICSTCSKAIGLLGRSPENIRNALAYVHSHMEVRPVGRPRKPVHRLRAQDEEELQRGIRLAYIVSGYNLYSTAKLVGLGPPQVKEIVEPVEAARLLLARLFG